MLASVPSLANSLIVPPPPSSWEPHISAGSILHNSVSIVLHGFTATPTCPPFFFLSIGHRAHAACA